MSAATRKQNARAVLIALALLNGLHRGQRRGLYARRADGSLHDQVAELCPRRWGKTEGKLRYAVAKCLQKPGVSVLYVALQGTSCRENAWPILVDCGDQKVDAKPLLNQYGIVARTNEVRMTVTFPNGSRIRLAGADHPNFARLFRGKEHDIIIIDEAQDFLFVDLAYLVREVFLPALDDRKGRLFMQGTPGTSETGYFYEVAWLQIHGEWFVNRGNEKDNHYNYAQRMAKEARLREVDPQVDTRPWFLRERRAEWVADDRHLVVPTHPHSLLTKWPDEWARSDDDRWLLSIIYDATSAYALCYTCPSKHNQLVYVEGWTRTAMVLDDHIDAINAYRAKLPNLRVVVDAKRRTGDVVKQLREGYGVPAEDLRRGNTDFTVGQLASEAKSGVLRFYNPEDPQHPEHNPFFLEWRKLARHTDPRTGDVVTPTSPLHEAAILARRAAHPHLHRPPEAVAQPTEAERLREAKFARIRGQLERRAYLRGEALL